MMGRILLLAGLMALPAVGHAKNSQPWQLPVDEEIAGLGAAHPSDERPHERWRPEFSLDWALARRVAENMVCELGVIALGLPHCSAWTELQQASGKNSVEAPEPEWNTILRQPIELRRRSI